MAASVKYYFYVDSIYDAKRYNRYNGTCDIRLLTALFSNESCKMRSALALSEEIW